MKYFEKIFFYLNKFTKKITIFYFITGKGLVIVENVKNNYLIV